MARRSRTTKNLFDRKPSKIVEITNPILREAIGKAERTGCWFVYGPEKNGKTRLALTLAQDIARNERVGYVSAEEGLDESFIAACRRAGINTGDDIVWDEYMSIDEVIERFSEPKRPRVIVIDNLTVYQDEITPKELKKRLIDALPGRLIILIGHEERNLPYPALGRMASKMAKVIFHVQGLKGSIVSRFGPGGEIVLDEERCELFWGS